MIINKKNGFTLIEVVIVLGIIVVVASMSFGIFVSMVVRQKNALAKGEFLSQSNYAFEYMSKAIRGAGQDITGECLGLENRGAVYLLTNCDDQNNCAGLRFLNSVNGNLCQELFLDSSDKGNNPILKEVKNGISSSLLSDKFIVKKFQFILNGNKEEKASYLNNIQPRVTIFLRAVINDYYDEDIIIQTTVSSRQ